MKIHIKAIFMTIVMTVFIISSYSSNTPEAIDNNQVSKIFTSVKVPEGKVRFAITNENGTLVSEEYIDASMLKRSSNKGENRTASASTLPSQYTYVTPRFDNGTPYDALYFCAQVTTAITVAGKSYTLTPGKLFSIYPSAPGTTIIANNALQITSMRLAQVGYYRAVSLVPFKKCGKVYRMDNLPGQNYQDNYLMITGFVNGTTVYVNGSPWIINAGEAILIYRVSQGASITSTQPIAAYVQIVLQDWTRCSMLLPLDN